MREPHLQVAEGDEDQDVLQRVAERGQADAEGVAAADGVEHRVERRRRAQPERVRQLQPAREHQLEAFGEQHNDRRFGARHVGALLRVARERDGGAVLEEQDRERYHGDRGDLI